MRRGWDDFMLDGEIASSVGIQLQKEIEAETAQPNVETVTVPGRNGDLLYFDGSYQNVKITASCFCIARDAARVMTAINAWLLRSREYRRMETQQEPDFFRLARLVRAGTMHPKQNRYNEFVLEFDAMPQKFYKDGEHPILFANTETLINLTPFTALPLITVHGAPAAGSVTIGEKTLTLTDCDEIVIDCEKMRAAQNGANAGSKVNGPFPVLVPGENDVSFTGAVSSVEITPRWWTI